MTSKLKSLFLFSAFLLPPTTALSLFVAVILSGQPMLTVSGWGFAFFYCIIYSAERLNKLLTK